MTSTPENPLTVAVLGTGIMGAGMARNLAAAGHTVRAWNRTAARAEPLAGYGITVVADAAQAVAGADVVLTMVLDGAAVLDAMEGAAAALRAGVVWVQSSTVGPDAQAQLAALAREYRLRFVDAPVLGSKPAAEGGTLVVLAAGPDDARPVADAVFDAVGRTTVWLGENSAEAPASSLKLVLNSWVLAVNHATGEVMALAEALHVDPDRFFDAIDGGPLDTPYLRAKAAVIQSGDYRPSFTVEAAWKDARLITAAAEEAGVRLDLAAAGTERLRRAVAQGHGAKDMAAAYFASFTPARDGGRPDPTQG